MEKAIQNLGRMAIVMLAAAVIVEITPRLRELLYDFVAGCMTAIED